MILQIAFGLLQNPTVQASPALKAQVQGFANQALVLAQQYQATLPPAPDSTSTPPQATTTPSKTVASEPVNDSNKSLNVIVPYVPPVDPTAPQVTFGVQTPAPATPPTMPTGQFIQRKDDTATFKYSSGDFDTLQLTFRKMGDLYATTSPMIYTINSNPFMVTGLESDAPYTCYMTATKGNLTATSSVLSMMPYYGRYVPVNCGL